MSVLSQVWQGLTSTQPAPAAWVVIVSPVAALAIVAGRDTWRLARNVITIAHEGGHAFASVISGRRLEGIRLHANTSGVTYSRGRRSGPGMVATAAAGYLAPPLLGTGSAWLLASGRVTAMLALLLILLAATLLAIRNAYGVVAVLATMGGVVAVTWLASPPARAVFAYGCSWFLLLGGVRPVLELRRRRSRTSDADHLARLTGTPAGLWIAAFTVIALAAVLLGARLLVPDAARLLAAAHLPAF